MSRHLPYLDEEAIERDAVALLAEFEHARGIVLEPPIPVEDIVEKHLKLSIEFDDLHARHNIPRPESGQTDILGAIYSDGRIFIDEFLDPYVHPVREVRYFFTIAHECGHWRLHRDLIDNDDVPASGKDGQHSINYLCRSTDANNREEWQANTFAASLLMPREMILSAWEKEFGDRQPTSVWHARRLNLSEWHPAWRQWALDQRSRSINYQLKEFACPLAVAFGVSSTSMRIRLEQLGLLHRTVPL